MTGTDDGEEQALAMSLSQKVSTRINESKVGRVASQTRKRNETGDGLLACPPRGQTRGVLYSKCDIYDMYSTERRVS